MALQQQLYGFGKRYGAARQASNAALKRRQIHYDLLVSLDRDLLKIPFDKESKSFSRACIEAATKLNIPNVNAIPVFGQREFPAPVCKNNESDDLKPLAPLFQALNSMPLLAILRLFTRKQIRAAIRMRSTSRLTDKWDRQVLHAAYLWTFMEKQK